MDAHLAGAVGAGLAVGLLLFIFLWVFLFHCLCPWRDVLRPWRDYEKPIFQEDEELTVVKIPKTTKPVKSVRVKTTPQVKQAPSKTPKEIQKIERNIVSTIAAQIERSTSLQEELSYDSVQQRLNKLPKIDEKKRMSGNRKSDVYMEPVETHKSYKSNRSSTLQSQKSNMSVVNVNESESKASLVSNMVNSYGNQNSASRMNRDYDEGSIISNSSRVNAMVKSFNSLSREDSFASSIDRTSLYSKPDKYSRMNSADPRGRRDSASSHTPSVPNKDLW